MWIRRAAPLNWNTIRRLVCAYENRCLNDERCASSEARGACLGSSTALLLLATFLGVVALTSCEQHTSSSSSEEPSIGVAYAGPTTLSLRKELSSRSAASISVPHGEEMKILETRRRFVRVRTAGGVEGWTDANLLLSAQQMEGLRHLSTRAGQLPSQGSATAIDTLNVHTEPARLAPSFFQVAENESVEVVGHSIAPRQAPPVDSFKIVRATPAPKKAKSKQAKTALLISAPPPPGAPANWEDLSRPRATDLPGAATEAASPVPTDDWSLVRTKDSRAGWVLSRMLFMSVPDDIAKYAEGHRVTAYLILGDIKDGDSVKHNWLWTTVATTNKCCEFDSFRVFVWSVTRHRYETAFVERNVSGFYPVEAAQIPGSQENGFSVRVKDNKDGMLYKRTYAFTGYHVRMISREPVAAAHVIDELRVASVPASPVPAAPSLWARMTDRVKRLWRRTPD